MIFSLGAQVAINKHIVTKTAFFWRHSPYITRRLFYSFEVDSEREWSVR
jgi:hypothetical protein